MGTFLPPIENPEDPVLKQIYEMSEQQWSKVLTPIKVFNADATEFGQFAGKIAELDQTLTCCRRRPLSSSASVWQTSTSAPSAWTSAVQSRSGHP